jgi:hypothetical protein
MQYSILILISLTLSCEVNISVGYTPCDSISSSFLVLSFIVMSLFPLWTEHDVEIKR